MINIITVAPDLSEVRSQLMYIVYISSKSNTNLTTG